jgi:hypothetical protein
MAVDVSIASDAVVVQDSEPVVATVDDEVVMLSARAGAYFGLNGVGTEIWNMLREPRRLSDLCRELSQRYEADIDTLTRDVTLFLQALIERGLVRVVPPGDPSARS